MSDKLKTKKKKIYPFRPDWMLFKCPFCGGEANLLEVHIPKNNYSGWMVHHHCQLFGNIYTYIFTDKKDCAIAWNRRLS